jgi:lipopolysaccharide export system protein LptC
VAVADNLYSRFVNWSKIILPLAAIALLSTLFMFAKGRGGTPSIPYAEIEAIAREPRLSQPRFSGVAADGSVLSIAAGTARPDPLRPDITLIDDLTAKITAVNGSAMDIHAPAGEIDAPARIVTLRGETRITTGDGYEMAADGLTASFDSGEIRADNGITVSGPEGSLTAGRMVIGTGPSGTGQQIVFNGGVTLIYHPQQ